MGGFFKRSAFEKTSGEDEGVVLAAGHGPLVILLSLHPEACGSDAKLAAADDEATHSGLAHLYRGDTNSALVRSH